MKKVIVTNWDSTIRAEFEIADDSIKYVEQTYNFYHQPHVYFGDYDIKETCEGIVRAILHEHHIGRAINEKYIMHRLGKTEGCQYFNGEHGIFLTKFEFLDPSEELESTIENI